MPYGGLKVSQLYNFLILCDHRDLKDPFLNKILLVPLVVSWALLLGNWSSIIDPSLLFLPVCYYPQ